MVDLETLRGPRRGVAHEKNGALETRLAGGPFAAERFSEWGAGVAEVTGLEEKNNGKRILCLHTTRGGATIMVSNLPSVCSVR